MATNGYVRRQCGRCIFYQDNEYGCFCSLKDDIYPEPMNWVSALEYERFPDIAKKYDEKCEHCSTVQKIKAEIRKKFNLESEV